MPRQDINAALIGTTVLLAVGIFVLDFFYPLGVAVGALYTPLVLITLWSAYRRFTLILAIGASILTVAGPFFPLYRAADWPGQADPVLSPIKILVAAITMCRYM